MPNVSPFAGWRYHPDKANAANVVAPPYDVIGPEEQKELYQRDPHNVVRVDFGLEQPGDSKQNNKYSRAAAHLAAWRSDGTLYHDHPSLYVCEQSFDYMGKSYVRRGFLARVLLEEFGKGQVFPHERTLSGPKVDRLVLMRATRGNLSPVFGLLADEGGTLVSLIANACPWEPTYTIAEKSGVVNRFWVLDHPGPVQGICEAASKGGIFIADGHHRYETAIAYRDEVRAARKAAGLSCPAMGELESDWIMMFCVPLNDPGLAIFPTHRLVHDAAKFDAKKLIAGLEKHFSVTEARDDAQLSAALATEGGKPVFGLVLPEKSYLVALKDFSSMDKRAPKMPEAWRKLDVAALHLLILEDLLGIDEGKLLRKENIVYTRVWDCLLYTSRRG